MRSRAARRVIDKSSAYRLAEGVPLVVPEVNGARALGMRPIIANPNCCTIPLTCVLKPLHDEAGLARVRVATYQSVSGAGAQAMDRLASEAPAEHDLRMDWEFDGEEFDEESKLRAETRKIMELPELPLQASCVRVPVMIGHAEVVWIETEDELSPRQARASCSPRRPRSGSRSFPRPARRPESTRCSSAASAATRRSSDGLALMLASDNLRKGAALNAIQIAELVLERDRRSRLSRARRPSATASAPGPARAGRPP